MIGDIRAIPGRYSVPVIEKAKKLIVSRAIEPDELYADIWWCWGNDPDRRYRIQLGRESEDPNLISYITCTCAHGLYAGAGDTRCSHSAAVLMALEGMTLDRIPVKKRRVKEK